MIFEGSRPIFSWKRATGEPYYDSSTLSVPVCVAAAEPESATIWRGRFYFSVKLAKSEWMLSTGPLVKQRLGLKPHTHTQKSWYSGCGVAHFCAEAQTQPSTSLQSLWLLLFITFTRRGPQNVLRNKAYPTVHLFSHPAILSSVHWLFHLFPFFHHLATHQSTHHSEINSFHLPAIWFIHLSFHQAIFWFIQLFIHPHPVIKPV